jgi:hypothetical protein
MPKLELKIDVGHLLTIVVLIATMGVLWGRMDTREQVTNTRVAGLEKRQDRDELVQERLITAINELRVELVKGRQ